MNTRKQLNLLSFIAALTLLLPAFAWATYPAAVARTGQTICYDVSGNVITCAGTGQDGDWLAGAPWPDFRFTVNSEEVTDSLTGLVWAQNANLLGTVDADNDTDDIAGDGAVTWQHALDYVAKLNNENYLNHNDWRLPNVNELESLLNSQLFGPALPLNHPFTNVQLLHFYWSSTSYANNTGSAWFVDMNSGFVNYYYKTSNYYVWPVRAGQCGSLGNSVICLPKTGQTLCYNTAGATITCAGTGQDGEIQAGVAWPSQRFADNGETVTDSLTSLEWTKNANLGGYKTWQQALDYVKTLNTGNHNDWRLPNERELRSLADYSKYNPALPQGYPFTNVQSSLYWSSTSYADYTVIAWVVDLDGGYVSNRNKTDGYYVWPVRAGQVGISVISTTTTTVISTTTAPTTTTVPVTTTTVISSTTTTAVGESTTTTSASEETTTTTTTTTTGGTPCPAKQVLGAENPKLENLRDFRDSKLANSAVGRKFISLYYNNADTINAALERSPALQVFARRMLETVAPMVGK